MKLKITLSAFILGLSGVAPLTAFALDLSDGQWVDLTHPFNEDSVYWPTAKTFQKTTEFDGRTEGGWYYRAFNYEAAEHGGTHIDAPSHFARDGHSTDEIPVERLLGPGVVIDVGDKAVKNRDYQVTVDDISAWEKQHGQIPKGAIVLFNTGSAQFYPDREKYMGTDERGQAAVAKLHFPGIHPDAARLLADERVIGAVGLDTPSVDYGQSTDFMSHRILYKKNIPGFENVADLDSLPPTGAVIFALPMKIEGGSGGPLRIIAFIPAS